MNFFPSKIDFPLESLARTRALKQLRISVFRMNGQMSNYLRGSMTDSTDYRAGLPELQAQGSQDRLSVRQKRPGSTGIVKGGNLTAEIICAFLGSLERSMTGPCPTNSRQFQPTINKRWHRVGGLEPHLRDRTPRHTRSDSHPTTSCSSKTCC